MTQNTMRKLFALAMVAMLALTLALALVGCGGQKAAEETTPPAATETMPPAETPAAVDTTAMQDTTMAH